jgi:BCD family chlorophyll transporter-like MFS transporter
VLINLMSSSAQAKLPMWRILKLGLFHIGSAMIDLLAFSVWNRVMIVELGLPATPVGLVLTLHNFLSPLLVWGGYLSDVRPLAGLRRLPYALGGRLLMVAPFPLLPLIAWSIASGASWGWSVAFIAFVLYGIGRAISGTAFLALIHDVAPAEQRGRAVGIVWTMLITGFAVVPILYARLLPVYDPAAVQKLFLVAPAIATALFFIALWGEEKRQPAAAAVRASAPAPLRRTLAAVWNNTGTRVFAAFLLISALFIFAYDQILEPFGGDVFSLPVGKTTMFNAYWGMGVLFGMLGALAISSRPRRPTDVTISIVGAVGSALAFALLSLASARQQLPLVSPALLTLGLSMGIFNVGSLALMMRMSDERLAGTFMGVWSLMQLMGRGLSGLIGVISRDLSLAWLGNFGAAYGATFALEAVGVVVAVFFLLRLDLGQFTHTVERRAADLIGVAAD